MNTIHIAYALNDKYAEMTCVSMCSVLTNCEDSEIVFHLFAEQLSREHSEKLTGLNKTHENAGIKFHNIRIDGDLFVTSDYDTCGLPNLTKETYVRVLMPDLLPDLERLIYLDCDTIIEGNIARLWEIDLGGALAGMVPDYSTEPKEAKKRILGIGESDAYFNGGVMLMNLAGLRKFQLSRKAAENVSRLYKIVTEADLNWYADQEVLNFTLRGEVKKLPMRYNSYFWISLPLGECINECIETLLNPVIVHFIGTPKPTELGKAPINVPEWERYYKYKVISPFAADGDAERSAAFKAREENTLNTLMPTSEGYLIHWYSFHFAKQIFEIAFQRYMAAVNGKNVVIWGLNNRTWTLAVYLVACGLEVKGIVDGLGSNRGIAVFDYVVGSPDVLQLSADETFVILDMHNYGIARQIMTTLQSWGYTADDYGYVFAPICEGAGI